MNEHDWFVCSLIIFGYGFIFAIMAHDNGLPNDRRIYLNIVGVWYTDQGTRMRSLVLWHESMKNFEKRKASHQ
jgi:hypothetical protein